MFQVYFCSENRLHLNKIFIILLGFSSDNNCKSRCQQTPWLLTDCAHAWSTYYGNHFTLLLQHDGIASWNSQQNRQPQNTFEETANGKKMSNSLSYTQGSNFKTYINSYLNNTVSRRHFKNSSHVNSHKDTTLKTSSLSFQWKVFAQLFPRRFLFTKKSPTKWINHFSKPFVCVFLQTLIHLCLKKSLLVNSGTVFSSYTQLHAYQDSW